METQARTLAFPLVFISMPKKQLPFEDDDWFDDDIIEASSDDLAFGWDEQDILEECGGTNASKGLVLYQRGGVTARAHDGIAIRAAVSDGEGTWQVEFDFDANRGECYCPVERRGRGLHCEHIAAALYAFINEPASFNPETLGAVLAALESNPALRAQLNLPPGQLTQLSQLVANAPPELRAVFDRPADMLSATELQQVQDALASSRAQAAQAELHNLLTGLTQNQLRAIAQRRGWAISQNKQEMATALANLLHDAPAPSAFAPEEEQLLRLENTLYGLGDTPTAESLTALWKRRSGGDMARLDKARTGLANAGLLFECRRERSHLHYHWSPLLDADALPLLVPKVASAPPQALARWQTETGDLTLPDHLVVLLELVAQTPLPIQLPARDPQLDQHPYLGAWNYDPADAKKLTQPRYISLAAAEGIAVPFPIIVPPKTLDVVAGALGLTGTEQNRHLHAMWLIAQLLTTETLVSREPELLTLDQPRVERWYTLSPDAQIRQLWDLWRAGGTFEFVWLQALSEIHLQRALYLAQQFTPVHLQGEVGHARRFVARLLRMLEPQTWYSWNAFIKYVHNLRADFLHTQFNEYTFWLAGRDQLKYTINNSSHWETAYRAFLAAQFETALRWLGVVELAYDGANPAAFQITPLGAWLLRNQSANEFPVPSPSASASDEPPLTWLDADTFRLRGGPNSVGLLAAAHAIAEPTSARLTFHITNDALARSWEHGSTPDSLAQKFSNAGVTLPDVLRMRLDTLFANYGRVHLYEKLTVLELADDFAVRELMASTSLRQYILHQFSPRVVVIRDDAVDKFVLELEKKGYTPRVV